MKIVKATIFYPDGDEGTYELGDRADVFVTNFAEIDSALVVWLLDDGVKKKLVFRNMPYVLEYEEGES